MDEAIWSLLTSTAAITAHVPASKIVWGVLPEGMAPPAIILNIIDGADEPHLRGTDGLWFCRVQVDCYAPQRPAARLCARAVIDTLNGASVGNLTAFLISQRDMTESGAVNRPARLSLDFNIIWRA